MDNLKELKEGNFEHREWVALTWVRQYMLFEGDFPDPNIVSEFAHLFSSRERTDIVAAVKMIFFFNMLSNTLFQKKDKA